MIEWSPGVNEDVVRAAVPLVRGTVPKAVESLTNVTNPEGEPSPTLLGVTCVVKVTGCPTTDGLADEVGTATTVLIAPGATGKTIWPGAITDPGGITVSGTTTIGAGIRIGTGAAGGVGVEVGPIVVVVVDEVVVVVGDVVVVAASAVVVVGNVVVVSPGKVVVVSPGKVVVVSPGKVVVVSPGKVVVVCPGKVVVVCPGKVVVVAAAQVGRLILLLSSVTAPFRASNLPSTVAPVVAVIEVRARIVPLNCVVVPKVAELPTCQKTLQDSPFMKTTLLLDAVVRVEPIWNMKTALGSPWVLSVRVPVS